MLNARRKKKEKVKDWYESPILPIGGRNTATAAAPQDGK